MLGLRVHELLGFFLAGAQEGDHRLFCGQLFQLVVLNSS